MLQMCITMWINCVFRCDAESVLLHMVRIDDMDTARDMAEKIYNNFKVGDFYVVKGWVIKGETLVDKGENVITWIQYFYEQEHYKPSGRERIFKYEYKKTIGGPLAHPIFKWERTIRDKEPHYQIWRAQ